MNKIGSMILTSIAVLCTPSTHAYLQADLDKVLAHENCIDGDLTNAPLDGVDLSALNLRGTDFNNASMIGANLSGSILQNTNLSTANLSNALLGGASCGNATAISTNFNGAQFDGSSWAYTNFTGATFINSTGGPASMPGADLTNANFTGATGVTFNAETYFNTTMPDGYVCSSAECAQQHTTP